MKALDAIRIFSRLLTIILSTRLTDFIIIKKLEFEKSNMVNNLQIWNFSF